MKKLPSQLSICLEEQWKLHRFQIQFHFLKRFYISRYIFGNFLFPFGGSQSDRENEGRVNRELFESLTDAQTKETPEKRGYGYFRINFDNSIINRARTVPPGILAWG